MMMDRWCKQQGCMVLALLLAAALQQQCNVQAATTASPPRTLKRQDAKKWERLQDVASAEIKVSTKKFLEERGDRLLVPLEVDVVMLGMDGTGSYHLHMDLQELEEILSAQHMDREVCPTIWETGHQTSTCVSASYVMLQPTDPAHSLRRVENAIRQHMHKVELKWPPTLGRGAAKLPVYEVDAASIEYEFLSILNEIYKSEGLPGTQGLGLATEAATGEPRVARRLAIFVINPSKHRLSPLIPDHAAADAAWAQYDINTDWARDVNSSRLIEYEAGYTYRYTYNGKGASQAWVSQYNFMVIDLSAGPTSFGPMVSVSGRAAPTAMPRILPTLEAMATEIEATSQITQHNQLRQDALHNYQRMLQGQVASAIGAATGHLLIPDIAFNRIEVNLVMLHDHDEFNLMDGGPSENGVEREVDMTALHNALANLLPQDMAGVVLPTPSYVHSHPEFLSALSRARISWSDAVMREPPYLGLHHAEHVRLDSKILLEEMKEFAPMFLHDFEVEQDMWDNPAAHLSTSVRHNGTRQVHVVVLSLKQAPPGLQFENGQLVAASHDMVVVLQLLRQPSKDKAKQSNSDKAAANTEGAGATAGSPGTPEATPQGDGHDAGHHQDLHQEWPEENYEAWEDGWVDADANHIYSGHVQDGVPLELDAAGGVTARIIAGLTTVLGGVTYPWERADPLRGGAHVQDWRWAVGCLPWGPYGNCTKVSAVLQAAIRRNHLISHIETALQAVQYRLDAVDRLVENVYEGPWMHVVSELTPPLANGSTQPQVRRHWLDALARPAKAWAMMTNAAVDVACRAFTRSRSTQLANTEQAAMNKRLHELLDQMGHYLEKLSWSLYLHQTWDMAQEHVLGLLHAADNFTDNLDDDIRVIQEVATCCSVRHGAPVLLDITVLIMFAVILMAFGGIALAVMANKKIYRPPVPARQPGPSIGGGTGGSRSGSMGGILPLFGSQGGARDMLPR